MKQFSVQSRLLSALLIGFSLLLSLAPASLPVLAAPEAPEAVTPTATLTIPPTVRIGESFSFAVTFDNTGTGTETGYGPYIDLFMPQAGVDGTTGGGTNDGISFTSATYLGTTVTSNTVNCNAGGTVAHPLTGVTITCPPLPAGVIASSTNYWSFVVLTLPFGSFTADQPPAAVTVNASLSNKADLGVPLPIYTNGGFRYGTDPLNNPITDPPISGTRVSATVTPTLLSLTKIYNGPEDETATGPNYKRTYTINVDIATGQPLTAVSITDILPGNMQFTQVIGSTPAGATCGTLPSTTTPGGTLTCTFPGTVTGTAGTADATLTFEYYIPLNDASGNPVINAATGDDVTCENNASGQGTWTPIDTRDPASLATGGGNGAPPEHILNCKSIAVQKSVAVVAPDVGATGPTPGDTLEYTLNFQVSDYFSFQNITVDDLFSDGQHFLSSFAPTMQINGNSYTLPTAGMAAANVDVTCNYTGGPGPECDFDDGAANDGKTRLLFKVSSELVTRGQAGKMIGGCVPVAGTGGPVPNCDTTSGGYNDGATTGVIKFRTTILDQYTDTFPSGNASLNQTDPLSNDVTVNGDLLSVADNSTPTGFAEADTSSAGVVIPTGTLQKTIYALNGVVCGTQPCANPNVAPTRTLTYRLKYTLPIGDFETLTLTDFLPLPIFKAGDPDANGTPGPAWSFSASSPPATATWTRGPSDTLFAASAVVPTVTVDTNANSVKFDFGTWDNPANTTQVIDILFTITATSEPFADGLFLTNQVREQDRNTFLVTETADSIVQVQVFEPVLGIRKGIIAASNPNATFSPTVKVPAGVLVSAPGSTCPRLSGVSVTSANLGTTFNSNVTGVDAGGLDAPGVDGADLITFAIVVENTGRAPDGAFDVRIKDTLPAGFQVPTGGAGLNLCVRDGTGAAFSVTNVGGGTGLLDQGIELVDPGPTNPALGALDRGKDDLGAVVTNGRNIVVVTFDLQLQNTVAPNQSIVNTATLTNFASQEGGPDYTTTDLTDPATTTIATGSRAKYLVATSESSTADPRVTIGEIVRYRLVWQLPEGTAPNTQFLDNLPTGLTFLDDGTAKMAFVSNDPAGGITSAAFGTLPIPAIPGGCTVNSATANATTPATLPCTLADANVGSSNSSSADPDSYAAGTDPFFKFGTLVNADSDDDLEYIVVEFNALVNNEAGANSNDYGDSLSNTFVPQVNGTSVGANSGAVAVNVSEPCLGTLSGIVCTSNLNKVVQTLPVPADAGGTVAYRITFSNATGANISTAFDTRVLDTLPASLQLNLGSVLVTLGAGATGATNASTGNTVDVTIATIPSGGTVQIDYTATILDAALTGDTVDNTANFTYTSLPGAGTPNGQPGNSTGSTTPGASGAANGERGGSGTGPNDYLGTDPAALNLGVPVIDKLAPTPASYTIGEVVTYNILVTLPEGTTQNVVVFDDLPLGLQYVASSLQVLTSDGLLAANFNGTLPGFAVTAPGGSGGDVTVTFSGNAATVGDNVTNNNAFLVRLQALVLNVMGNQNGTVLTNNASARYTDPESGVVTLADPTPPTITVVEPILTLSKTIVSTVPSPPQVGSVITYRITVNHAAGSARTAYDTRITDFIPTGLTLDLNSIVTTLSGATGATNNSAGNNVDVVIASIPVGGSVIVECMAAVNSPAGLAVVNTANTLWSTLPGADPNERGEGDGNPDGNELLDSGALNDYEVVRSTSPLAVTLAAFTAEIVNGHVVLNWETGSELNNRGFNLWRGTSPAGPDTQLNQTLIPSQSQGNPSGFEYTWTDQSALTVGVTYYYWLEDVSIAGVVTRHGPVSITFVNPLAVSLASFDAVQVNDTTVRVSWETVNEIDLLGFNLYRAETQDGPWTQINAAMIAVQNPGSAQGNEYNWTDTDLANGSYWYQLEWISVNSVQVAATTQVQVGSLMRKMWMPMIVK